MKLKFLSALLISLISLSASAFDFEAVNAEGKTIYYNKLVSSWLLHLVEVTSGTEAYSGTISIPEKVTHNGVEYTVTRIGYKAFWGCGDLTQINFPNTLTLIGEDAFDYCNGLTLLDFPESLISISDYAFWSCRGLRWITIPNSVTTIGQCAFEFCSSMTSVKFGDSVTTIGKEAFNGCSSLVTVEFGNCSPSIGGSAFAGCNSLGDVHIGSLEAWCNIDFADIYSNPLTLAHYLFLTSVAATHLEIPDSVPELKQYVFSGYSSLTSIIIYNGITKIADGAFSGCSGLTSLDIPDSVTSIGAGAFSGCTGITSFKLPDAVTSIGASAFSGCTSITSFKLPDSVTSVGDSSFEGCSSLSSIEVSDSIGYLGGSVFAGCSSLTSFKIPSKITRVREYLFDGCASLTSVDIPYGMYDIYPWAFRGCTSLTSITFPRTVTNIYPEAFAGCSNLADVFNLKPEPQFVAPDAFSNYSTLHVVPGSGDAYRNADYWKNFTIVEDAHDPTQWRTITFGASEFTTYCSDVNLDFSKVQGVKAYLASSFNPKSGTLIISHVDNVPGGEGFLLKGTPNESYEVPLTDDICVVANLLEGSLEEFTLEPEVFSEYRKEWLINYVLTKNSEGQVGFYRFSGTVNMPAHKAWLPIPYSVVPRNSHAYIHGFSLVEDSEDMSGIAEISGESFNESHDDVIYDMQGRRLLSAPASGLYIINGKKAFK